MFLTNISELTGTEPAIIRKGVSIAKGSERFKEIKESREISYLKPYDYIKELRNKKHFLKFNKQQIRKNIFEDQPETPGPFFYNPKKIEAKQVKSVYLKSNWL